jgi:ectoine hydroxylase-related dioxygenase (phytanoyl-CoA dioxygenase family)
VFDALYLHPLVLNACSRIFNEPFKLSTMHARTLRLKTGAQNLHVDYKRDCRGWTLFGFIYMVNAFQDNNGATRFVPGSHLWSKASPELLAGSSADYPDSPKSPGKTCASDLMDSIPAATAGCPTSPISCEVS